MDNKPIKFNEIVMDNQGKLLYVAVARLMSYEGQGKTHDDIMMDLWMTSKMLKSE